MRDPKYLAFLREHGRCEVCGAAGCDPAHYLTNGTASKGPDNEAVPLCRICHDEQHATTWPEFERRHGLVWKDVAAKWWGLYTAAGGKVKS